MRPAYLPLASPDTTYVPPPPPELGGARDVVLNFATTGFGWARGDRPVGVTVSVLDGGLTRFLPFAFRGGGNLDENVVRRWAQQELRGKCIYNSNTRFDIHHAREWGVDLVAQGNTFSDIGHTAALLDGHRLQYGVDALAADYLPHEQPVPRLDESRHAEYAAWEVERREQYTAQIVARLHAVLSPQIDALGMRRVQDLEDRVIPVVVEMEKNGLPLDVDTLERWEQSSRAVLDRLLWELYREAGFAVNPKAPTDMQRLFASLGLPVSRTDTGRPSFSAEVLGAHAHVPVIQKILRIAKLRDLRTKTLEQYLRVQINGKLYPRFHQLKTDGYGALTGRFSSSDPNGQNVQTPQSYADDYAWLREYTGGEDYNIRRLFRPGAGVWLSVDADQIEFRLTAHYAKGRAMLAAYAQDPQLNYHKHVQRMLERHNPNVDYGVAKTANFLTIYGGQAPALAKKTGISIEDAEQFREMYFAALPEIKALMDKATGLADSRGYVRSLLGRRVTFPYVEMISRNGRRYRARKNTHAALNYVIQPSAADINKTLLVEVYEHRKELGITLRATVHDEIDGDVPDASYAPKIQAFLNEQRFDLRVPILWSAGTGRNWAEAK